MESETLFERGKQSLPGGVCASTRLNQALGRPLYVSRAEGSRLVDVEGREILDMSCSHGAALLGHGHPAVCDALRKAAEMGICCSSDTEYHVALGEAICRAVPCAERVRFTNSGSEATLHALRLCRAATGRDKILRFLGHFHGYHELTYIGGQPPADQLEHPERYVESPGIPKPMSQFIISVPFNDLDAVAQALEKQGDDVATVILEPVNFNSGGILPQPGYLEGLRELTSRHGALLFFDEIQTGFKKSPGGAQEDFGVVPDICTIGKTLGGGLPLSAICGPAPLMDQYKPAGEVQHSGTFMAPLPSVLGGLAFCDAVTQADFYPTLLQQVDAFHEALDGIVQRLGLPVQVPHHGARFGMLMGLGDPPVNYMDALRHRVDLMLAFIREAFDRGVYFHDYGGRPCHHGFSIAHTGSDLDEVLTVMEASLEAISGQFA